MARNGNGKTPERKTINLALQGGGSHGAFTWGVLDALLEDGRIDIDGISGTSSGAMNAVALAQGFAEARRDGKSADGKGKGKDKPKLVEAETLTMLGNDNQLRMALQMLRGLPKITEVQVGR